jgi:NADP-dependent 3-hydroxy acid dehydrogenase YdfG
MVKKTALVFGATGGIGQAIVQELAENYNLGLSSTSIDFVESHYTYCKKLDIRYPAKVESFVSEVHNKFKSIDVLVNSAGITNIATIEDLDVNELESVFSVNVLGLVNTVKAVLPIMIKQKRGHIILIGSLRAFKSVRGKAAYCMSKAAVSMFSKVLRKEVKDYNIKVTVINPGFTDTDVYEKPKRPFKMKPDGSFEEVPITLPIDIAKSISYILGLSEGTLIEELNIGELFGERQDICLRERQ